MDIDHNTEFGPLLGHIHLLAPLFDASHPKWRGDVRVCRRNLEEQLHVRLLCSCIAYQIRGTTPFFPFDFFDFDELRNL